MKIAILISALYKYHYYHYYHFYIPSAELVALAIAGCVQDGQPDGHYYWSTYLCSGWRQDPSQRSSCFRFCVSLISVPLFGRFSFFQVYGVVDVHIYEVSVGILFASCDIQSIVCPCKLNFGRQYCQFVFKLCEVGGIQDCSTFRVLPRTLSLNVFAFGNFYLSHLWGSKHAVFFISFVG